MDNRTLLTVLNSCLGISKDTSQESLSLLADRIARLCPPDTDCIKLIDLINDFIKLKQSIELTGKLSELKTFVEGLKSALDCKTKETETLRKCLIDSYKALLPDINIREKGLIFNITDFKQQMTHVKRLASQLQESINTVDDKMSASQFAKYSRQCACAIDDLKSLGIVANSSDIDSIKALEMTIDLKIIETEQALQYLNNVHLVVVFRQLQKNQNKKIEQLSDEILQLQAQYSNINNHVQWLKDYHDAEDKCIYLAQLNELATVSYYEYLLRDLTREEARERLRCINLYIKCEILTQEKQQAINILTDTNQWLSLNDTSDDNTIPDSLDLWVSQQSNLSQHLSTLKQQKSLLSDVIKLSLLCFQYASFAKEEEVNEQEVNQWLSEHKLLQALNKILLQKTLFDAKEADIKSLHLQLKQLIKDKNEISAQLNEITQNISMPSVDHVFLIFSEAKRLIDSLTPKINPVTPPPAPASVKPPLKRQPSLHFNELNVLNRSIKNNWFFIDNEKSTWYENCYRHVCEHWSLYDEARKLKVLNFWSDLQFDIVNPKNKSYPIWSIYQSINIDTIIDMKPALSLSVTHSTSINHEKLDEQFKALFLHCNQLTTRHPREALLCKRLGRNLKQIYIEYQETKNTDVLKQMNRCVNDPMYLSISKQRGFKHIFNLIDDILQFVGEKIDPRKATAQGRNYRLFNPRTTSQKLVDGLINTCQPLAF